jgi:hypothetical protein
MLVPPAARKHRRVRETFDALSRSVGGLSGTVTGDHGQDGQKPEHTGMNVHVNWKK